VTQTDYRELAAFPGYRVGSDGSAGRAAPVYRSVDLLTNGVS
jgi:hypothetical protein